jgi:hypothetical protein
MKERQPLLRQKEPPTLSPGVRPHLGKVVVAFITLGAIQSSFLGGDYANYSLFHFLVESVKHFKWNIGAKSRSSSR